MTLTMRHGMEAFTKRKDGTQDPPDIHRLLYRPWLYMGTKLEARRVSKDLGAADGMR